MWLLYIDCFILTICKNVKGSKNSLLAVLDSEIMLMNEVNTWFSGLGKMVYQQTIAETCCTECLIKQVNIWKV